jgi:hypothetical protein
MVQCPAMNTPQFDWARYRMQKRPQPVPPIYQPEAVARAVYRAARENPRELWVGGSTLKTIAGAIAAPALLDRMLARIATDGQMSDEPAPEQRQDNLFESVTGEYGAHGRFDERSANDVLVFDPRTMRTAIGVTGMALGLGAIAWALNRARGRD